MIFLRIIYCTQEYSPSLYSTHQRLIQLPETAAVQQRSALSVSCRWDRSSVSTPTLRETVLGTSVRSVTAVKETDQPYVDISEFTPERSRSPVLTAPTELPQVNKSTIISDVYMQASDISLLIIITKIIHRIVSLSDMLDWRVGRDVCMSD